MLNNDLPTIFYITEVAAVRGRGWDHVVVRHRAGAAVGRELGHAMGYYKALTMVHLFGKSGDKVVKVPLRGDRYEFILTHAASASDAPTLAIQQEAEHV